MNGASLCNSLFLHSRFKSPCSITSSSSPSSVYLSSPCFTTSAYISFPQTVVIKRSHRFRSFAVNKRRSNTKEEVEEEEEEDEDDEDWDEFEEEDEGEGEEEEGEFLPMEKMKQWLEKKPRGFGVGKKYETLIEDKLLEEIEQSWKAQAANLNKLKNNDPLNSLKRDDNNLTKGETQSGFRVRVTNLPKKKNVHRDLKAAFKEVSGVLNIEPAVSGNKKTKDPVCKGFALVYFKTEVDANRFVEQFNGQRLSFGKVVKQIKCQAVEFSSSNQSVSEELRSDTVFEELPFPGLEAVSSVGVVEEDAFVDSWEEESSDDSDKDVDETEVEEEEEDERIIESPKVQTTVKSQRQSVKRETREHEELETPLVSFQAVNKSEEAVVEALVDDDDDDDEHDRSDDEEAAKEKLEPLKSSVSSSDEERIERIRRLELKLLGREKLLGGGAAGSDKPEAKAGGKVEGEKKKKEKKKKKKILVKGKKSSTIEIPGSSKRLKVKEKAMLTGVLVKYAAKAASTSNDK